MSLDIVTKNNFLVFSDDWGEHPSSCQHIFMHIAKKYAVLWVNTVGMRLPIITIYDLKKAVLKLAKMFHGSRRSSGVDFSKELCFNVEQPFMLPLPGIQWAMSFNQRSVVRRVSGRLKELNMQPPIMVVTSPNACDFVGSCGEKKLVYYCVDDYSEWPGMDKKMVQEMELSLIHKADVLIATSQALIERIERYGRKGHLLTHGVDVDFFGNMPNKIHKKLVNIPKPRVGYFGLFDERSNKNLLLDVARQMPDVSFVITGNVETKINQLEKEDNIHFTGSVPYKELPDIAKGYDICMLPYKINKLTDAIQPLKIKEYLSTGKPVISTPITESLALKDYIDIADATDAWVRLIRFKLHNFTPGQSKKVVQFLENEKWEEKSNQFLQLCLS